MWPCSNCGGTECSGGCYANARNEVETIFVPTRGRSKSWTWTKVGFERLRQGGIEVIVNAKEQELNRGVVVRVHTYGLEAVFPTIKEVWKYREE